MRWLIASLIAALPLGAQSDTSGTFDYYVLSLSWSPNWCALEGDARGSDQCDARHDHGWILHGLWPQYESGFPDYCQTSERAPSRQMTAGMADIMGTSGLAWHQWKKHGTCAGVSAAQYFDTSREAYARIKRPEILRRLSEPVRIAPQVVEQAFLEANPELRPDQITITCRDGHIQEARVCLTRALEPRQCGRDVIRDCSAKNALFTPVR
ncbi:ribonuclease T [Roseobacter denitrificans]|uniref:Ribonuclease T2 family n=1 Tax=Roseobacter denitrificans (strain ATCC 33942 / OCh 114) TaxID=375451 RepID=Q16BD8_ROSDO|nr:ribonuclease T2 [Roseobacter denitrificans]ABG30705.1 ribonuclease T2 family [Roseobacter denitrificans OCh 114]AVL53826.1 ribonuclease T [Roseobacter denitrificans]SFG18163.1 ribonuclease T2 [Roseobacter denitrificans OCh 114]